MKANQYFQRSCAYQQPDKGMLIEGMIIGSNTAGASYGIIYLRGEYLWLEEKLNTKIQEVLSKGIIG